MKNAIAQEKSKLAPERAKKVENLLEKLDQAFPQQVRSGKEALQNPNKNTKQAVDADADAMNDILDEIADATAQPSLYENAERLKAIADKVPGTSGDVKDALLKSLNDVGHKLQHQGNFFRKLKFLSFNFLQNLLSNPW